MFSDVSYNVRKRWLKDVSSKYVWVALFSAEPADFTADTEVTGSGYERQQVSWSNPSGMGVLSSTLPLTWTGIHDLTTIAAVGVMEGHESSLVAFYGAFRTPQVVTRGSFSPARDERYRRSGLGEFTLKAGALTFRVA